MPKFRVIYTVLRRAQERWRFNDGHGAGVTANHQIVLKNTNKQDRQVPCTKSATRPSITSLLIMPTTYTAT